MAQWSHGRFTARWLEDVERGHVALDDALIDELVALYEVTAGPVIPQRSELVLDLDRQQLSVDGHSVGFNSLHVDDIIGRYVSLVYMLRGAPYGSDLVLRDRDLDLLGESLGTTPDLLRRRVETMVAAPESVQRAKQVRGRSIVMAAGLLVGLTAMGSLVLVGLPRAPSTEVLSANQALVPTGFSEGIGAAAEASIDFDIRSALPGWQIRFAGENPDFLGVTLSAERTITIHVRPGHDVETVAAVLMHEVGHAIDLERLDDAQRAEWLDMRSMPRTWWPGNGLSDFAVGAGDFAEAVSALTTDSPSDSVYGEFTQEQLDFVAEVLG